MTDLRFYRDLKATKPVDLENENLDFEDLSLIRDKEGNYYRALIIRNEGSNPIELTDVELEDKRIYVEIDDQRLNPSEQTIIKFAVKEDA